MVIVTLDIRIYTTYLQNGTCNLTASVSKNNSNWKFLVLYAMHFFDHVICFPQCMYFMEGNFFMVLLT